MARLWTCLLLAPGFAPFVRGDWCERLKAWSLSPNAPRDHIYFMPSFSATDSNPTSEASNLVPDNREPTSVFQLALDVSTLPMEVSEEFPTIPRNSLSELVRGLPPGAHQCTCPFCGVSMVIGHSWGVGEDFVTACLRVSALHVMGYGDAATRLAVTLANALLACLEDVSHRGTTLGGISSGPCSPTLSQSPNYARSNSGNSGETLVVALLFALS